MDGAAALPASASRRLVRDRLTVALDVTFVTWGWFIYVFSPTVPLLAAEQHISRGVAGLHGTAMAVGTVATGLVSERVAFALGRKRQLFVAMAVMSLGVALLLVGPGLAATLSACALTAVGGNLMLAATQPALLGHHGPAGPAAVTEGNAYATAVGLLAPLALGLTVGAGFGWRPAVAVTVVAAAIATVLLAAHPDRRAARPSRPRRGQRGRRCARAARPRVPAPLGRDRVGDRDRVRHHVLGVGPGAHLDRRPGERGHGRRSPRCSPA